MKGSGGRSTGVKLQTGNNTEGTYRKTIIWRQVHHIFFTWIICTWMMDFFYYYLKQNKAYFQRRAYTSETRSALDNSQKLMSAYILYKIDSQTIFG